MKTRIQELERAKIAMEMSLKIRLLYNSARGFEMMRQIEEPLNKLKELAKRKHFDSVITGVWIIGT